MMSEHEFDVKLRQIQEQFEARKEGAVAYRDQEMARLFEESGWTQEAIARHVTSVTGKVIKQQYVSRRLKFGAFLKVTPVGVTQGLTEGRFREYHATACRKYPGKKQSAEKERLRFAHVAHVLEHGIPQSIEANRHKPGVRAAVLELLADGKAYTVEEITATVEEKLPGVTADQVRAAVGHARHRPPAGKVIEARRKKNAHESTYRLVPSRDPPKPGGLLEDLYERAAPLIDELDEIGTRSQWKMIAAAEVRMIAVKLRRLFDSAPHGVPA